MLDPHGIPGALLTSAAGCGYIAGRPSTADGPDHTLVRAAMTNLARVGLVSIDPGSLARTVRTHPSVQAAVRAYLPAADFEQAVLAAADALMQAWPEAGGGTRFERAQPGPAQVEQAQVEQAQVEQAQLEQALRDCTGALLAADQGAQTRQSAQTRHDARETGGRHEDLRADPAKAGKSRLDRTRIAARHSIRRVPK
jgi:hypothetical protein